MVVGEQEESGGGIKSQSRLYQKIGDVKIYFLFRMSGRRGEVRGKGGRGEGKNEDGKYIKKLPM